MRLDICITQGDNNYVVITEQSDGNQYLPEGTQLTAKNRFEYNDTAAVDVFKLNSTTGVSYSRDVITMRGDSIEDPQIKLEKDGWFTAIHIVIPKSDWVYKELDNKNSIIYTYNIVYFTDGERIYTCTKGKIESSSIDALLAEEDSNTTISRVDRDYVSIVLLSSQVMESYNAVYEKRVLNGSCGLDACEANRLNAAINLIRHYVRIGQLAEAERIIEKANYYVGYEAEDTKIDTKKITKCGCL